MKRNVLIYGLIIGAILVMHIMYMVYLIYNRPDFQSNDVLGYIFLFGVFSLVFFGIRNYRNKELNGFISLGKAFKTGALIALLASTIYVAFWPRKLNWPPNLSKWTNSVQSIKARSWLG